MSTATQFLTLVAAARARRREQWASPAALADRRADRLRRVVDAALRTEYYRGLFKAAGLAPGDVTSERDLPRLPLLDKQTLQAAEEHGMLSEPVDRLLAVSTSGSTGQRLKVFRSARDQAEVSALWFRILRAFGHRFFDSQVNISSGSSVARGGPVALLRRFRILPQIHHVSSFEPVDRLIEILRQRRPHTFSSYAIGIEVIADVLLERGIPDVRPKVLISAAMPLSDRGRAMAAEAFGVYPLDVYVAAELGTIAWECPEQRDVLHLNDDMQIVEILDDRNQPLPDGETGEVVITQLCCTAQPLLRYRLGDLAARIPGPCPCGRGLGRLSRVQGRTRHVIRTRDGRMVFAMRVSGVVKQFHEVRRWQLRQIAPDAARLLVVPSPTWQSGAAEVIRRAMDEVFGQGLRIEVLPVEDIPLAPTGKFQTIVPLPDAPGAATS